jgi:Flp pilus assembly protein TadD
MRRQAAFSFVPCLFAAGMLAAQQSAATYFEEGRGLFGEHDDSGDALREAEAAFRQALQLDPRHAASVAYLGLIAAESEHWQEAAAFYHKALDLDAKCAEARVGLAHLAVKDGRRDQALSLLREAVAAQPENRLALRELGYALTGENLQPRPETWNEARKCWQTLIRLDRDDRDSHQALASGLRFFKQWEDAAREYREVLRIGQTSEDSDVWVYTVHGDLAEVLEKQGRLHDAMAEWRALANAEGAGDQEISRARARIAELEKNLRGDELRR